MHRVAGGKEGGPHPGKDGLLCSEGSAKERERRQRPFPRTAGSVTHTFSPTAQLGRGKQGLEEVGPLSEVRQVD